MLFEQWKRQSVCLSFLVAALASVPAEVFAAPPSGVGGEQVVKPDVAEMSVGELMKHVGVVVAKAGAQNDTLIEKWLNHAIDQINKARPEAKLTLPVQVKDLVNPAIANGASLESGFVVGKGGKFAHVNNSILWIDGDVEIAHCRNSVIVATGVVAISHSRSNIVVANHLIDVSFDGDPRARIMRGNQPPVAADPSLLISPGYVELAHATESVVAAGDLSVSHASGCAWINVKKKTISHETQSKGVQIPTFMLGTLKSHPLADELSIRWTAARKGAVINFGPRRFAVDVGQSVMDSDGKPVQELTGWILSRATDEYATFRNEKEGAVIVLRSKD